MKKLGQKLSFLTKIMLVVGLLISNLSSLSIVFAYEASDDLVIELTNNILKIVYSEQLTENVEAVDVKVYENYTYSEDLSETEVVTSYSLTAEQLLAAKEGVLELTHNSIFDNGHDVVTNFEIFDGTYSAKVEIIDVTVYEKIIEEDSSELESETEISLETNVTETTDVVENTSEIDNEEEIQTTEEESIEVDGTIIASNTYEKEILHASGLNIKLFDVATNEEITLVDGKYPVSMDSSKVKVVAQILSGGLKPDDVFEYNGEKIEATEIINKEFSTEVDFAGHLYGEYEIPVEVKILKQLAAVEQVETLLEDEELVEDMTETNDDEIEVSEQYEEIVYTDSINVLYESYESNASFLNNVSLSLEYDETYLFYSEEKDGYLYVLSDFEEISTETDTVVAVDETEEIVVTKTMLDLYNILKNAIGDTNEEAPITYTLVKNGINVLELYDETTGVSLEDYLATITLDDTVVVTLSNDGLSITYSVVVLADLNNDNLLTDVDLLELIDQFVGASESDNLSKSDIYRDGKVDSLDVLYLNQIIDSKSWLVYGNELDANLDASLNVLFNGKELSEENYLTSGDVFNVDYVLSLTDYDVNGIAGLFDYDKTLFELVSFKVNYDWMGNNHEGKFLYLGGEALTKPELEEETTPETETPELEDTSLEDGETGNGLGQSQPMVEPNNYVVVTATFKALRATSENTNNVITLKDIELFNSIEEEITYYVLDQNVVSTEVINVTASSDNTLSYLEVAGIKISLEDGVYEYEITVDNEITAVDLKYILSNVAASVTSEVYPEELAEGNNTIVVTVMSESGVSIDYTITVIREKAPETTTQVNNNYYYNDYEEESTPGDVTVTPGTTDKDDSDKTEEDSNLSRIIIIVLILIVIAGLVYLIFKDDDDETKKTNKEINKLKKEPIVPETTETKKVVEKTTNKASSKKTANKNSGASKSSKNKKKEG